MRRSVPTSMKMFLCVVVTIFICRYFYISNSPNKPLHKVKIPTGHESVQTVNPLPASIARLAFKEYHPSGDQRRDKSKLIFAYAPDVTYAYRSEHIYPLNCEDVRCAVTTRGNYFRDSHAVIFSGLFLEKNKIPQMERNGKVFILFEHRPLVPEIARKLKSTLRDKSVFNWTIGYSRDADIGISYGTIVKKKAVPFYNLTTVVSRKKRTVVIFQQSCKTPSRLEDYLKQLRKYVKVDIYGPCVNRTLCDRDLDCFVKVGREYKFYLAFEDVFCSEYISDVFFRFYGTAAVPIVRGGGDYSSVVPKGTYINTADFKSIAELGKYIQYLDKNDTAYIEILKRKRYHASVYSRYQVVQWIDKTIIRNIFMDMNNMMCDICRRLWNVDDYRKTYSDILTWYGKSKCTKPADLDSRKPATTRASNSTAVKH